MKILAVSFILLSAVGCASTPSQNANDSYVPWWVEQGVPNSDGTVITK